MHINLLRRDCCVLQGTPDASTQNATEAAFSPPSMLPWLEGTFSGAYVAANLSDPFQVLAGDNASCAGCRCCCLRQRYCCFD